MAGMDIPTYRPDDMLERVVGELERRTGQMRTVATESGLAYDTVLRIKNREGEPAYGKVRQLHDYLFLGVRVQPDATDTTPGALDGAKAAA